MISFFQRKLQIIAGDKNLTHLLNGAGIALVVNFFSYIAAYIFIFYVGRKYGPEGLGMFSLLESILNIGVQLSLVGMGTLIVKLIGESRGNQNEGEIRDMSLLIIQLSLVFSCLLGITLFYSSARIGDVLFGGDSSSGYILMLSACMLPFCSITLLVRQALRSMGHIFSSELIRLLYQIGIILGIFLLPPLIGSTRYVPSLSYLAVQYILGIGALTYFFLLLKKLPSIDNKKQTYRTILTASFPMFLAGISTMLMRYIDTLMVGSLLSLEDVGIYSAALKASMVMTIPLVVLGGIVSPEIARLQVKKDKRELSRVLKTFSTVMTCLALPVFLLCMIFPGSVLGLLGSDFVGGEWTLRILSIGYIIHVWSGNNGLYMNMSGYQKQFRDIVIVTAVLNILLNLILVPLYGILGAAISTAGSVILWNLWANRFIYKRDGINIHL